MSTNLTPTQQARVAAVREFLGEPTSGEFAYDLGKAKQHLRNLLEVIGGLTGGGPPPTHTDEGITGMYWDSLGSGGAW